MKLQELQLLIFTDLAINDQAQHVTFFNVDKLGGVFYNLRNKEVIGIRVEGKYLLISVK